MDGLAESGNGIAVASSLFVVVDGRVYTCSSSKLDVPIEATLKLSAVPSVSAESEAGSDDCMGCFLSKYLDCGLVAGNSALNFFVVGGGGGGGGGGSEGSDGTTASSSLAGRSVPAADTCRNWLASEGLRGVRTFGVAMGENEEELYGETSFSESGS